jgi:hypothetical protein
MNLLMNPLEGYKSPGKIEQLYKAENIWKKG